MPSSELCVPICSLSLLYNLLTSWIVCVNGLQHGLQAVLFLRRSGVWYAEWLQRVSIGN